MTLVDSTVRRRELGRRLRTAQQQAGLDGKRLADLLGWTETRVSRMLTGHGGGVREVDVAAFAAVCGVRGVARERLLRLGDPNLDEGLLRLPVNEHWSAYLRHAGGSVRLVDIAPCLIPWLAQTQNYTHALVPAKSDWCARRMAEDLLDSRQVDLVLSEWALRTLVGDPGVMFSQLCHLTRIAARPTVSLRVVPAGHAALAAGYGPFTLLEYGDHRPVVYREEPSAGVFVDADDEVSAYRAVLAGLDEVALTPRDSHDLLVRIAADFDAVPAVRTGTEGG